MKTLEAQVVIAVHAQDRPVRRAVESVLQEPGVGVIVVAHGICANSLDLPKSDRLVTIEWADRIGFPGAAFNAGLSAVSAPLSGIMGSDDWYEPGAITAMLTRQRADRADGVLAPLDFQDRERELNPLTMRRRKLRGRRDRLFTRTAPIGLFRTEFMQSSRYQMRPDVPVGGDHQPSLHLWTDGLLISHYPQDPAYVVGADAKERVTTKQRPLEQSLAPLADIVRGGTVAELSEGDRLGLIAKQLRIHILHPVIRRTGGGDETARPLLTEAELAEYSRVARLLHSACPGAAEAFSAADQAVLAAVLRGELNEVQKAVLARTRGNPLRRVLPRNPLKILAPESNLRTLLCRWGIQARLRLSRALPRD